MKLHEIFLVENDRKRKLGYNEAVKIAEQNYSNCLQYKNPILYRGSNTYHTLDSAMLVDPTVNERKSFDSTFGYTEFISNLPSWKNYPKRNKSLILSANRMTARMFGYPLPVLLPNNFTAIITDNDFWNSFSNLRKNLRISSLDFFDRAINSIFYSPSSWDEFIQKNVPHFINGFNKIKKKCKNLEGECEEYANDLFYDPVVKSGNPYGPGGALFVDIFKRFDKLDTQTVINYFNELLSPENNDINLVSSNLSPIANRKPDEVWTNNTCMILTEDLYYAIRKSIIGD